MNMFAKSVATLVLSIAAGAVFAAPQSQTSTPETAKPAVSAPANSAEHAAASATHEQAAKATKPVKKGTSSAAEPAKK